MASISRTIQRNMSRKGMTRQKQKYGMFYEVFKKKTVSAREKLIMKMLGI